MHIEQSILQDPFKTKGVKPIDQGQRANKIVYFYFVLLLLLYPANSALAINKVGCWGIGAAETFVPGLGYLITGQWSKSLFFGGGRWIANNKYFNAVESPYYQEEAAQIYYTTAASESASGKEETEIYLNKATWTASYYGSLGSNLLFISWGDLYHDRCGDNTDTASLMLSPFRITKFYDKWMFWAAILPLAYSYANFDEVSKINYNLGRGLKESDLKSDSLPMYYMVGVGEEFLFRGAIQNYFFELMSGSFGFSRRASRHLSIFSGATVFGLAHNGAGFTASPAIAFLFGVYLGYVYHPSVEEFDLTTAIAIHSWWNILVTYNILNHATYSESEAAVEVPLFNFGFRF